LSAARVVLVGFMGAGKSTTGRALARRLGWRFCDLDRLISERSGMTIAQFFQVRGEAAFREEEQSAAASLGDETRLVVAAGGGAFAHAETRELLRSESVSVWLRCSLETCLARIGRGRSRPLAADREKIGALFAERQASYALADLALDSDGVAPDEMARRVVEALGDRVRSAGEQRGRCGT
jgi:shikimate kinase